MDRRTEVTIIGAGPVGLAAAIELGHRGIRCVVIERNDRVGYAPRAKTTNLRTREHMRRWGIAGKLREASPFGVDYPSDIVFVTRLDGEPLARFENAFFCRPDRDPRWSEHSQWIPQYVVENVLREHAQSLPGVTLRFRCELERFTQDADGVQATVRDLDSGRTETLESAYLIGADGSRSTVRELIGATMHGDRGLSRNYNVVFRAPRLAEAHRHGRAIMYWQVNQDMPSLLGPMDRGDKWFFMPTHVPAGMTREDFASPEIIRRATGIDLPYEILSSDEWVANRLMADRYVDGRVALAGDACHLHPPFGGYGMNMGISDAVDLGWKIAAMLQGWGGRALLDSYSTERRPVHAQVLDEAVANHAVLSNQLWQDGLDAPTAEGAALRAEVGARIRRAKAREFRAIGVVLGYRYAGSPVIAAEDGAPPAADPMQYQPSSYPGGLAPHGWLDHGRSLYDLFGPGFALLARPDAEPDALAAARSAAAAQGCPLPLTVIRLDDPTIAAQYDRRLTLVRPDQHIAWRGDEWPDDDVLAMATGRHARTTTMTGGNDDGDPRLCRAHG